MIKSLNASLVKLYIHTVNSLYNAEVRVHSCERLIEKSPYNLSNVL